MNIEQNIRDYLPNIVHMSLATVRDDRPWVCEVHFVYDDELNLYFRSRESRRHSQEIAVNPHVAGTIVTQYAVDEPCAGAVYFEGRAELLQGHAELERVAPYFRDRLHIDSDIIAEAVTEDGAKFYKVTVENYFVFGAFENNPPQKYQLPWKCS